MGFRRKAKVDQTALVETIRPDSQAANSSDGSVLVRRAKATM